MAHRYRYAAIKTDVTIIVTATISVVNAAFSPRAHWREFTRYYTSGGTFREDVLFN